MTIATGISTWVHFLRKHVTDPVSRGTDVVETFTASEGQTVFTVSKKSVNHISSVTLNDVVLQAGTQYTYNLGNALTAGSVTLTNSATEDDVVVISFHYNGTWVYPDFPRKDATMPRISVTPISHRTEAAGLGSYYSTSPFAERHTQVIEIGVWIKGKDENGGTINSVKYYSTELRDRLTDEIMLEIRKYIGSDVFDLYPIERLVGMNTRVIPYEEEYDILRRVIEVEFTLKASNI